MNQRLFQAANAWTLRTLLFLLPLFFLPITTDFFEFHKLALLVLGVLLLFILWALSTSSVGFRIRVTPLDLPVVAFAGAILISTLIATPNKLDAFVFPGTTTLILACTLLYFLTIQHLRSGEGSYTERLEYIVAALFAGGGLSSLISLVASTKILEILKIGAPSWLVQPIFSPAGPGLVSVLLFVLLLFVAVTRLAQAEMKTWLVFFYSVGVVILAAAIIGGGYWILPGKDTSFKTLPFSTGWSIVLETLKKAPVFGVGPGNFAEAFARFRPVEYNNTGVWNLRFFSSSDWYLNVFTIAGMGGILTFAWIVWRFVNILRAGLAKTAGLGGKYLQYSLAATLVLFALFPVSLLLLVVFYTLLALVAYPFGKDISLKIAALEEFGADLIPSTVSRDFGLASGLLSVVGVLALAAALWLGRPVYLAEVRYRQALDAVSRNDGLASYNLLREVITLNPRAVHYRTTNSQVNLAIANSLATNVAKRSGEEKKPVSDQDRAQITQLVQQAIGEGKAAISLAPRLSPSWANLASIYRSLIGLVSGADQFAVASYQQAIALEPTNPAFRIELGGVFYSLKVYDEAVKSFELAVAAKPDFANAHYNLALALREEGKFARAADQMRQTLTLVSPGSRDWEAVQGELKSLEEKASEAAGPAAAQPAPAGEQPPLQAPQPAPSPVVKPPLEVEGSEPPATGEQAEASPSPTLSPTPTPTPRR